MHAQATAGFKTLSAEGISKRSTGRVLKYSSGGAEEGLCLRPLSPATREEFWSVFSKKKSVQKEVNALPGL